TISTSNSGNCSSVCHQPMRHVASTPSTTTAATTHATTSGSVRAPVSAATSSSPGIEGAAVSSALDGVTCDNSSMITSPVQVIMATSSTTATSLQRTRTELRRNAHNSVP